MLKNGVGRYNIFFFFLHKACWILPFMSFSCRIRQCFCSSTIRFVPCAHFLHQQIISHMRFPEWVHCQVVWILRGWTLILYWMQENQTQRRISFVLGYLRMILWKISTAISIKHRILATFNIKQIFNSDSLYAFKSRIIFKYHRRRIVNNDIEKIRNVHDFISYHQMLLPNV